jgi:hypothetical protein
VRVPNALLKFEVLLAVSLLLMLLGSILDQHWLRGWSLLFAIYASVRYIVAMLKKTAAKVMDHTRRWAHQPFESGYKSGFSDGREAGVAEGFALASGHGIREERSN